MVLSCMEAVSIDLNERQAIIKFNCVMNEKLHVFWNWTISTSNIQNRSIYPKKFDQKNAKHKSCCVFTMDQTNLTPNLYWFFWYEQHQKMSKKFGVRLMWSIVKTYGSLTHLLNRCIFRIARSNARTPFYIGIPTVIIYVIGGNTLNVFNKYVNTK